MKVLTIFVLLTALIVGSAAQKFNTKVTFEEGTLNENDKKEEREIALEGKCNDNLLWMFTEETSTLTISGTGNMSCCGSVFSAPWSHLSSRVQSIEIQEGVSSIDDFAFFNFARVVSVSISSTMTWIGSQAFDKCTALQNVAIPENVLSIGSSAFRDCASLTSITIPLGVTSIYESTFNGCSSLRTVVIASKLTSIELAAFYACKNLASITIPSSVKSIGTHVFFGCESLTSITIPSGVTSIKDFAFCHCISLKTVNFMSNITSIGRKAFYNCSNLQSITIPSSVVSIGAEAFSECKSLSSITIPSGVTSINNSTFSGCISLESVTITSTLTSIGSNAFYGCASLSSVVYLGLKDPDPSGQNCFNGSDQLKFVCVSSFYCNTSFCGLNHFCKHESCDSFTHNYCYHPVCNAYGVVTIEKKFDATIWKNMSNCFEFLECDNDSGPVIRNHCHESGQVCENDQCVVNEEITCSVVIEVEGINVINLNMTEIRSEVSSLTNVEKEKLRIRVDVNDQNGITRIIVIVGDEEIAETIRDKINLAIEEHNQEGVAKYFKSVLVVKNENYFFISRGMMEEREKEKTIITAVILTTFLIYNYVW